MKIKNLFFLALSCLVFISCEDEESPAIPCIEYENEQHFELTKEAIDAIPYIYNEDQRLVFKNKDGEVLVFFPRSGRPHISEKISSKDYRSCPDGEDKKLIINSEQYAIVYKSNSSFGLHINIELETDIYKKYNILSDQEELKFYDKLKVHVYQFHLVNEEAFIDPSYQMQIPVSFRNEEPFELNQNLENHLEDNFKDQITIGEKVFYDVHETVYESGGRTTYSKEFGLISFTDYNDVEWVIDRF